MCPVVPIYKKNLGLRKIEKNSMSLFYYLSFLFIQHFLLVKCDAQPAPSDIPPPPPELVPGLYIFGDSYVDVGLNSKLDTLMTATYRPYGIDFAIGATGRFTNGGTIMDYLDRDLGLPTTVYYTSEQFLNNQVTTGFNYASGSAGILHETGRSLGDNWSMGKQIAMFNKTVRENLPSNFKGSAELSEYLSKCLFIVHIGSSDYTNNYLQTKDYNTSKIYNYNEFGSLLTMKLEYQLKALYKLGARNIVVFEIGPLGCYPGSLKIFNPQTTCVDDINKMVSIFNTKLNRKVEELRPTLEGAKIIIANVFKLIMDIIDKPSSYGFTDSRNPCCKVGRDALGLCIPNEDSCADAETNLFWDDHHLTEATYKIIAEKCFNGSDLCTPKSIQEAISSGQTHRPGFFHLLFVAITAGYFLFLDNFRNPIV